MQAPILAANWKMQLDIAESAALAKKIANELPRGNGTVILCPTVAAMPAVSLAVSGREDILLGAQDCHNQTKGTFTGATSPAVVAELGCTYVIVGHSERRQLFGETDEVVAAKVAAAVAQGLIPILCVGETADERKKGESETVVTRQLTTALASVPPEAPCIVAYEPLWAISHGAPHPATKAEVTPILKQITTLLEKRSATPVLYGGSVLPDNVQEFVTPDAFAGALIGGASLTVESFLGIVATARRTYAI
ncbi:triose-phosphate isomerase [Candidatus Uhrbacteria bacterium CG10_big_fil_rev_8_21_14_0_10_48_11]|uniref:Triosephosphate isomerase n=1 Tax=Candidatus Uhrbacteria bacterium CG10_big_fil_rev_8_21_14_0_10_48_11 TaxID=1975037 RepID=A0A2M8LEY8_9BACT|nr:MAG: triose-phosphate isomerase [Candidatus Uhrbacteria bacterium CG10_big_fil_rev_8_21_14_0_10_48_11]